MVATLAQLRVDAKREGWDRFIRTASDEVALLKGFRFSKKRAERVQEFGLEYAKHYAGRWAGQPFELLKWQRDEVVFPLFGWVHKDPPHPRRFRRAGIWVPKKNGKSSLCSLLSLYLLTYDGEAGAEVYAAAVDRKQSRIVFGGSAAMVARSPSLKRRCKVIDSTSRITYGSGWYEALSSENATSEGRNIHGVICDELHVWNTPRLRKLWAALYYGGVARDQPLAIVISTAGEEDPEALWTEEYEKAKAIVASEVKDIRFMAFVAEATAADVAGEGWKDPKVHKKANPSYGTIIDPEEMADAAHDVGGSPSKKVIFLRYRLNRPVGQTTPWLDQDVWDACDAEPVFPAKCECVGAFDLSKNNDFTCYVVVRREPETDDDGEPDDRYHVKPYFWVPEDTIAGMESEGKYLYRQWADAGLIEVIPGPTIKLGFIRRRIPEIHQELDIRILDIGYDPWNAWETAEKLAAEENLQTVELRQGIPTLAAPSKKLEELLLSGKLNHGGHPILAWMFGNVKLKWDDNENFRPAKPDHKSPKKVDGIVALVMAIHRAMAQPAGFIYDKEDIKEL